MFRSRRSTGEPRYVSATRFNWREFLLQLALGLLLLLPLPVTWLALQSRSWTGMKLDTWKALPGAAQGVDLLPRGPEFGPPEVSGNQSQVLYGGGGVVQVNQYASHRDAVAEWSGVWENESGVPNASGLQILTGSGLYLVRGALDGAERGRPAGYFVSWVNGPFEFWLYADSKEKLDNLISASTYIDLPSEAAFGTGPRPLTWTIIDDYPWAFALGLEILILLFMWAVFHFGLKLGTRRPPKGSPRVGRDELIERLLALNHPDAPFTIDRVAAHHLVCRWRLDEARFVELLAAESIKDLYQLDLYVHAYGAVGVLESRGRVTWDASALPPRAGYSWNAFRGLVLADVAVRRDYSFDPQALRFAPAGQYSLNIGEYRRPILQTVLASGWTWRPILLKPLFRRG